ncbi:cilia- and flagella-associated protein 47 [Pyrgilauda ruficollis]|uniref:cilia- and flagella-associated protein 47 n=1 Tax=Pyrgilauda ruficollis TaxID=221976 RepID=UPI001B8706DC|nr:cilia- and flagella-associated protein 47 [Pyrgilauda ruficollis]
MAERWRDVCGVRIAPAELRFSDTVPRSCYRAALTVQNLRAGACHLRLLPPRKPQFKLIVENPEKPIASGLYLKAVVEYTPKSAEDLQDKLTLLIDDDVVHIPVLGLLPHCDLEIESEVDFGEMIANNKLVTKEIIISNRGTISGVFRISYDGVVLLNIKPVRGVVKPKSVRKIKVDVCTDVPGVIKEMMKVELESRGCTEVWIKGVVIEHVLKVLGVNCGKVLKCINFGPLYFGTSKTEKIHLYNESPECMDWVAVLEDSAIGGEMGTDLQGSTDAVLHDLSLQTKDVDVSTVILCAPNQGTLQPYEKSLITLCFSPEKFERDFEVNDASLVQDYVVFVRFETAGKRGGCLKNLSGGATATCTTGSHSRHVDLALKGSGFPVILSFKPGTVINFEDCYLGEQAQVLCTMKNESKFLPVTFRFRKTAHFSVSPARGKVKRKSEKEVRISFSPHQIGKFEMKQIIDIIGTGVDKNNVQVLKTKAFHQIYLTLFGVCKPKQTSIVFTINPGLTPLISNATGQFVARGTGQPSDTAPVAILKSTQTQIHTHRKNRNCEDDALIAFPNDRAASLRPSEWDKKYRTIFTKTERYNYVDPEFAYTDSERLSREQNRKHYVHFISHLRQRRLEKEAARQFYIYNNAVSIGIKPAKGLKSPNISITDFPMEKPKPEMRPLDDNCMLTGRKLAAIVSKSTNKGVWSWLSPMPSSDQEKEDCSLTLTPKQLHQIFIGPSTIDFGDVCVYSTTTKELHIINNLSVHIWIQIEIEVAELQETSPLSQVVPPLTKTHIPVVFETVNVGIFKSCFSYKINNQHTGHVLVAAHAMPIELQLSRRELILSPVSGCLAGTEFRRTVRVCNPRNYPAGFTWRPVTGDRKSTFTIKPTRGFVEAYSEVECEVVWHPGFSSPETGQFTLSVRKGNSINLKCFAKFGATRVQLVAPSISFAHSPIGFTTCKTATILNTGRNHAYFQVLDSNPVPGMKITPTEGVIPVGGLVDLKISFSPKARMSFDKKVEVAVRNAAELILRISGFSEITEIGIDVGIFEYQGVYVGSTKSIPFLLQNKGQSCTRVQFDFSKHTDFKLNAEDNSAIDRSRSKPYLYSVYLKEGSSLQCFLTLTPKRVAVYDFILPIAVPRVSSPTPVPTMPLKRGGPALPPPPEIPALPNCKVRAIGLQPLVQFSSMEFKFEQHLSYMNSSTADMSMNSQNLVLKCLSEDGVKWKLNFDDADKNIEDGIFRFSLRHGHIKEEEEVSITVYFWPPCPGTYTSEIMLYLNDNSSQYILTLSGTMRSPKIEFHPPFLMLMPVPLDVETEEVVTIIPQDFIRQSQIRVRLPQLELADGTRTCPFSVEFPEGQNIVLSSDGTANELTCRISFKSSKPMSFLGEMLFIDQEDNRFSFQVAGTADNCLLTLYPYLAMHNDQKIIWRSNNKDFSTGEVVLQPCFTPSSPSHSYSASSLDADSGSTYEDSQSESIADESGSDAYESEENEETSEESETDSESDGKGNKHELSFFPDEDEEEYNFFQKTLNAVQSWFALFGWSKGQNPISIPYSLRRDVCIVQLTVAQENTFKRRVDKDKCFYDMLLHLNGQPIGIATCQSLSPDPVEKMFQLHWQHSELLAFLKRKGACLPHVMPEFLLEPEDYEIWTEVNTGLRCFVPEVKRGSVRSSGKLSGRRFFVLESRTFETMSKRAWTDVLLQMYKVFVLPRVSSRMIPDPASLESLQNMPGIKSEPLCSNIYSRYERSILIWLNKNYEKNRKIVWKDSQRGGIPPMRWIVNFDQDLLDGLVLAAQMAAYCPYLIPTHFIKMYTNPRTHEQFLHNALLLVKALHTINLDMDIKATDICDPNPVMMLILCVHLYDLLPHYLPKNTIEFSGALHATIVKQVHLKNPSNNTLSYTAVLVGRDAHDFSLPKGNTVTIPSTRQGFVNVEFTIRFLHPAEAVLLLTSNKVDRIDGATMTFSLKSEVRSIEPLGMIRCRSPCYEVKKFNLNVTNPFKNDGIFRVILLESTHLLHPEKVFQGRQVKQEQKFSSDNSILNSKISALPEDSKKESSSDQSGLLHEFFSPTEKLFLKGKGSAALDIHFLPFYQEKRYCTVIMVNEKIGEFVYLIEGIGDLPLTSELPALDSPNVLRATSEDESTAQTVLYLKCGLGQTLEENLKIPLINESRERALALAAQQQMSAVEYERRLMTGTLQSSSVRVATALLGLSRVQRRALLKPCKHPSELKYVNYNVEVSMKHVFVVPKKFSIPVLSSARVNLDTSSDKCPASQKTVGSDTVEFPIKFTPKKAGCYHCQIVLKSSWDIRVYEIECVVNADQADAQLEFLTPAYQTVTQEIPITNISSGDWKFEAVLEGQCFHGPSVINVPVGGTVPYPLTFKPVAECVITGRLILRNVTAGTQNIFSLKGIGKKPLPQDCILIECQVGKVAHKILWVHNYTKKMIKYKVYSNLSMLSGAPDVVVNPEDTAAYTLSISPCRRGVFQGVISFVAQDEDQQQPQGSSSPQGTDGKQALQKLPARTSPACGAADTGESSTNCKVWYSLKIFSAPAAAERTIDVDCKALDTVGINIPITNPTNKVLNMSVLLDHPSLFGEKSFTLKPKQTFSYHLQFSAAALGSFAGSVMFRSDVVGEFWYALKFNVEKPSPTVLPDIGCELGKWVYTHIPLANPTHETLALEIVNSDPSHFAVETDPKQPLTIPPHSTTQLPVRFCPSALGRRNHKATITFKCPKFGERIFYLTGSGVPPERMETTTISACIGEYSSAIIAFKNPTVENVVLDVVMADEGLLNERLSASVLSQATCNKSGFHLLFKQPQGIQLAPKEKLEIPILFMPAEMKIYKAVVVIHVTRENGENWPYEVTAESNSDLNRNVIVAENGETQGILWIYPINGTPQAPQQQSVVICCQARQRLEQRVELLLIGVIPGALALPAAGNSAAVDTDESSNTLEVTDGSSATLEFLYELQYQSNEIRSQLESFVGMELVEKEWDTESRIVTLIFNVVFAPNKPMRNEATVVIQCTAGGLWKFPLVFIATEPEVDDVINIEAVGLHKESIVGFKLTSQTRYPEPFTAHFLPGSDPDFLVMPQAGELLPEGTVGTHITVGYKPRMYGKKHTATLVIETQSMQWTYIINGLPPQTAPPTMAAKVVCTSSYTGSFTVRQRNFVRENLKLITTGASSPIKGAPLVLRNKQRKL